MEFQAAVTRRYIELLQDVLLGKARIQYRGIILGDNGEDGTGNVYPIDINDTTLSNPIWPGAGTYSNNPVWDMTELPWVIVKENIPVGDDLLFSEVGVYFETIDHEDSAQIGDIWLGVIMHFVTQHKASTDAADIYLFWKA